MSSLLLFCALLLAWGTCLSLFPLFPTPHILPVSFSPLSPYCNSHGTLVVTNRDGLAYCTCDLGYGGQHCEEPRGNTLCVQAQYDPIRIFTRCAAVHMF
jgi:hypothetical protein